ncbi:MAG TPA: cupin domain-containing protein [Roseomonas sp.]|jgi:quercetin dioxygenase-like cupin family protein
MSAAIETLMRAARPNLAPTGAESGRMVHLLGMLITFKATTRETGGAFSLVEVAMNLGSSVPLHRHEDSESFLVLEGEVEFTIGRETLRRGEGDFVQVPGNVPHGFRQVGSRVSRMLGINMPGHAHEGFFLEAGAPVAHWAMLPVERPDFQRIVAAGLRHGIVMLPPV